MALCDLLIRHIILFMSAFKFCTIVSFSKPTNWIHAFTCTFFFTLLKRVNTLQLWGPLYKESNYLFNSLIPIMASVLSCGSSMPVLTSCIDLCIKVKEKDTSLASFFADHLASKCLEKIYDTYIYLSDKLCASDNIRAHIKISTSARSLKTLQKLYANHWEHCKETQQSRIKWGPNFENEKKCFCTGCSRKLAKSIGLFHLGFQDYWKAFTINEIVTQREVLVYILLINDQENLLKNGNLKNEWVWACKRQGNNTVTCNVTEAQSIILKNAQHLLKNF